MTSATPPQLDSAVQRRYDSLADSPGSLSCGGALDLAEPRQGDVLVDLGSGRGRDVIRAAERIGAEGRAIGVDFTPAMVEKARSLVPSSMGNVSFVCSDLAAVPLPNASADVVVSDCAINHAADKAAVYHEIHRILKSGGRFVVSDIVAEQKLPERVKNDPEAWAGCYGGAIPEADYLANVRAAGFSRIEILRRSAPYPRGGVMIRSLTVRGFK
jgi:arsenite methyltransferase